MKPKDIPFVINKPRGKKEVQTIGKAAKPENSKF
jgi:hypothetical protein